MNPEQNRFRPTGADKLPTSADIAPARLVNPPDNEQAAADESMVELNQSAALENYIEPTRPGKRTGLGRVTPLGWVVAAIVILAAGGVTASYYANRPSINQSSQQNSSAPDLSALLKTDNNQQSLHINFDTVIEGKKLTATGPVAIQNEADSDRAFTIQQADGTNLFTVDTSTGRVGIGGAPTGSAALQVTGSISTNGSIVATGGNIVLGPQGLQIGNTLVCTANGCISSAAAQPPAATLDVANVALLNKTQIFTGDSTFISSGNSFTGSGAGLTGLNASNIASGSLSDSRLSGNVALLNRNGQIFRNTSNSAGAFQIQNAAGTSNLFIADTLNSRIAINKASANYPLDVAGDVNSTTGFRVNGTLICTAGGCTPSSGSGDYIQNTTTPQTADFSVTGSGTVGGDFTNNGTALFKNTADSTTAFEIQNANGTAHLFVADTVNARVAIAQTTASYPLDVGGDINSTTGIRVGGNLVCSNTGCITASGSSSYIQNGTALQTANFAIQSAANNQVAALIRGASGQSADVLDLVSGDGGTNLLSVGGTGATTFRNSLDSTTAFQVQNAAGGSLLSVDTANSNVSLGKLTTGALSAWSTSPNSLPASRSGVASVISNGYVYIMGGCPGPSGGGCVGTSVSTVYYSKLNPDGSTGAWQTSSNPLPAVRGLASSVAANGYIYVIGGTDNTAYPNGLQSTVYYAKQNADGSTGAWQTNPNALPQALYSAEAVTANGYVYVMGGAANISGVGTNQSTVYYAKLNSNGSTGSWSTNANALPSANSAHNQAFIANGYIYYYPQSNQFYYAKMNADGSTGSWATTANPISGGSRANSVTVVSNGYSYVIGGYAGAIQTTVYYSKLNSDGTANTYNTNANALPLARQGAGGGIYNGYIYVIGGDDGSSPFSTVYYASVQGLTRNAGQSSVTDQLTVGNGLAVTGNSSLQAGTDSTSLFSIQNASGSSLVNVDSQYSNISLLSNNSADLGPWTFTNALPQVMQGAGAVNANGYAYVVGGGGNAGTFLSTVYYAKLNADGTTSTWTTSANPLPQAISNGAVLTASGYIYVIGGVTTGNSKVATVYYAKLNADGSTGAWATGANSLPQSIEPAAYLTANGYAYIFGGLATGYQSAVYYAKLNADGSTGAWTTSANPLPQTLGFATAVTANGYVYVMGGTNGTVSSAVYYAKLNADGSTGAWTTSANPLPVARDLGMSFVSNGYIYLMGGSPLSSAIYYAKLNINGSTGGWSTSVRSLPQAINGSGYILANGYVYVMGGNNGSLTANVAFASTSRIQIGGNLDLLGIQGGVLSNPGDQSLGSSGGSITAGNGMFVGSLQVQGQASFAQNVGITGNLSVSNSVAFQDATIIDSGSYAIKFTGNGEANADTGIGHSDGVINIINNGAVTATFTSGLGLGADPGTAKLRVYNGNVLFDGTSSTTAFQVQNASGQNLLQVDTANSNITLAGLNSGALSAWTTNATPVPAIGGMTVTANGYIYYDTGSNLYYTKANADGSMGSWTTATSGGGTAVFAANGYLYEYTNAGNVSGIKLVYARLNTDGSVGSWQTSPNSIGGISIVWATFAVSNGYAYELGGDSSGGIATVYYAKLNGDGSVGTWQTNPNPLPATREAAMAVVANGYIYLIGGDSSGNVGLAQSTVYYAKLNSDGTTGAWQNTTALPAALANGSASVSDGYVYMIGGYIVGGTSQSTVYYAKLNSNGTVGSWVSTSALPAARTNFRAAEWNGYIYVLGGYDTGYQTTAYYASTSRIKAGANLDLIGLQGGDGSVGGSINAGNITANGGLTVRGASSFLQGINVGGSAAFQNSQNSTTAFQIQDSSGASLFTADTSNMNINVSGGNLILNPVSPSSLAVSFTTNQGGALSGAAGTTYYYKVTGIIGGKETAPSNEVSVPVTSFTPISAPGAASPGINFTAGNLNGTYTYKITYVTANGETTGGTTSSPVSPANQQVNLNSIPTGPAGTIARKIYRTSAGGADGTQKLVTTINDNTTTSYTDNLADASLGAALPGSNTALTNNNQIRLFWAGIGADSYRIYRGTAPGAESIYLTSSTNTFTDTGAAGTAGSVPASSAFGSLGIGTSSPAANLDVLGTAKFKSAQNSSTAFQVQNSSGAAIVSVDTANGRLSVGNTGTATGQLYVSGQNPVLVGQVASVGMSNTPTDASAISGNYEYFANISTNKLTVYDVSNPTSPVFVGQNADTNLTFPMEVAVQGHYAYVTEYNNPGNIVVYDISNPTSPTFVGQNSDSTITWAHYLYVSGRYAYVSYLGSGGLAIYDISNPAKPTLVSNTAFSPYPNSIYVLGRYMYMPVGSTLKIYDVSNPASPSLASSMATAGGVDIEVSGRYAYLAGSNKLQVFDISNPASPVDVSAGGVATNDGQSIVTQGRYAYVGGYGSGKLQVFDISNPASPVDVSAGGVATSNTIEVMVSGRYAYAINYNNPQLQIFDLGGMYSQQLEAGGAAFGALQVNNNGQVAGDFNIQGSAAIGGSLQVNGNLGLSGSVLITTNSATAFQVQNATGTAVFTVDTSGTQITLGPASATPVILVLGTKDTAGDPACTDGGIYYNSNSSQFRGCANGTWTGFGDNKPSVRAYNSADENLTLNTLTVLSFDSERFDTDTMHDTVTNNSRLVAKTAGTYMITGNIQWSTAQPAGNRVVYIRLNGTTDIATDARPMQGESGGQTISTIYYLAANDYVELTAYHNGTGTNTSILHVNNTSPEFSMVKVAD